MKKPINLFLSLTFLFFVNTVAEAQYQTFLHDGMVRKYILHLPSFLPPDSPLVFLLHGYGGTSLSMMNYTGMNSVADDNNFAVCYPEGTKDEWGWNCWNLGYDFQIGMNVNDVDFLDSLAFYLQNQYQLDPEKTFCSGHSNGGDMCYRIACQDAGNFKAIASVSGCLMKWIHDSCINVNPIPVLEIHGTEDQVTLWDGDLGNSQGYGPYYGVPFTFDFWDSISNCQNEIIDTLPDVDPTDGSIIIRHKRINGIAGNQVWLYEEDGAGHGWPGSGGAGTNMDINASTEIWDFFQTYINGLTIGNGTGKYSHQVTISPNPTKDVIKIILDADDPSIPFVLFDLYGREVIKGKIDNKDNIIDLSACKCGVYLLNIMVKCPRTMKVIKQ
jgi:polyhydroxybutyrate depolymerase